MRFLAVLVCVCASGMPSVLGRAESVVGASVARFERIWPKYREAESFERIAEYFGGAERRGELVARSRPEARAGYYFLTRVRTQAPVPGAILALEYTVEGDDAARVQFFSVDLPVGSPVVLAGLTGEDWPSGATEPSAWRLRLLGGDGAELAREQSFLWALPPGATPPQPAAAAAAVNVAPPATE
jgi:hypothetical protein